MQKVESGSTATTWKEFFRDPADNVERVKTSQGAETKVDYNDWDRVVRTVSGTEVDGRLAAVGVPACTLGEGDVSERAYDAAGHVVRERRLQDYVEAGGASTKCRFVEMRTPTTPASRWRRLRARPLQRVVRAVSRRGQQRRSCARLLALPRLRRSG